MRDDLEVCAIKVPPKEEIIAAVKASPGKAWEAAKEATPSLEDIRDMKMPDVKGWWETGEGAVSDFGGKVGAWWSKKGDAGLKYRFLLVLYVEANSFWNYFCD